MFCRNKMFCSVKSRFPGGVTYAEFQSDPICMEQGYDNGGQDTVKRNI
jgi:hypothetical protein